MTLPKRLLDAASTDETRQVLHGAYIDTEARAIICTNGRILTMTPIPGDAPVKPGYISPDTWKIAKARNSKAMEFDYASGLLNGESTDMPEDLGVYPNWRQVYPTEIPAYRITLNPKFIADIAGSFGQKDEGLTFHFSADALSPAKVTMGDKSAVIMPMRGEEESGLLTATDADAEKLRAEVADLQKALLSRMSECSDKPITTIADEGEIAALRTALFEARARVKELESIVARKHATAPAGKAPSLDPKPKEKAPVPPATERPTITRNDEKNGIELRFNGKPDDATRDSMKAQGFRWLPRQAGQPWAAKYTEERWLYAQHLATGSAYTPMPESPTSEATPPITPDPRVRKIEVPDF
jgi:hypothetical protein